MVTSEMLSITATRLWMGARSVGLVNGLFFGSFGAWIVGTNAVDYLLVGGQ